MIVYNRYKKNDVEKLKQLCCSIEDLRSVVGDVARRYGVKKVALFGSYSNGTQTPESDIDLLIDNGKLCNMKKQY